MTSVPNSVVAAYKLWVLSLQPRQVLTCSVVLLVAKLKQRNPSAARVGRKTNFFLVGLEEIP